MEGNNPIQLSSNSLARFKKADRLRDIAEYKHFKAQFEVLHHTFRTIFKNNKYCKLKEFISMEYAARTVLDTQ